MIIAILAELASIGIILGACLFALLIIGYRAQVRRITEAANRNAGYWAEAEAKLAVSQLESVQLACDYRAETKRANELSRIAQEALKIAHHKEFAPKEFIHTGITMEDGSELIRDPNENYAVEIVDDILDAGEIG